MTGFSVGVLGPLRVVRGDAEVILRGGVGRALVATLALASGRSVSAERLIGELWGDDLPGNPVNALQARISQLRKLAGADFVLAEGVGYRLSVEADGLDAHRFERSLARARQAVENDRPADALAAVAEASGLLRGPPLVDAGDGPAVTGERVRLTELAAQAATTECEALLALGRHEEALARLTALVEVDPLRERHWSLLMLAQYRVGRQAEALRAYQRARDVLSDTLGVDPGPELAEMEARVLRHDPELALRPAVAARSAATVDIRGRIRVAATSFTGRQAELEELEGLLDERRLVTLVGPGGFGKSRIAVEIARRAGEGWDGAWDAVWLAGLVGLDTSGLVADEVIEQLGLHDRGTLGAAASDPVERLAAAAGHRRVLLVLDNCEHLVEAVAELVDDLLAQCPNLRVLATSREALGIGGEQRYPLAALGVPPAGTPLAEAARFDALDLFVDRARAVDPSFALDEANVDVIVDICRRLDGNPLALELAAARVRFLTVEQVAERLEDRFGLLTSGPRGAPAHQQSLRALVEWSHQLLFDDERSLFEHLGVFRGGITIALAARQHRHLDLPEGDVEPLLGRLVDKSLVLIDRGRGEPRFVMLETLRHFALERLDERGARLDAERAMVRTMVQVAQEAERSLRGPQLRLALQVVEHESDNLRAALDACEAHGWWEWHMSLCASLGWAWSLRGQHMEARQRQGRALAAWPERGPDRALCLVHEGLVAAEHGERQRALELLAEAIEISLEAGDRVQAGRARVVEALVLGMELRWDAADRSLAATYDDLRHAGDAWGWATALFVRVSVALGQGQVSDAQRLAAACLAGFEEAGDPWGMARANILLAVLAEVTGDPEAAVGHFEAGRAGLLSVGIEPVEMLGPYANSLLLVGRVDEAKAVHEQACAVGAHTGVKQVVAFSENGLGLVARHEGDLAAAQRHHERARAIYDELGASSGAEFAELSLGAVAVAAGRPDDALPHVLRGLDLAERSGDPRSLAHGVEVAALVAVARGELERAGRMLGGAHHVRAQLGSPALGIHRAEIDRAAQQLADDLGEERQVELHGAGAALSLDVLVGLARSLG